MNAASAVRAPVRLAEIFRPEAVLMGLGVGSKAGVIEHLVRHAAALGHVPRTAEDAVVRAVLERERLGTTALGNGIAFPHYRSASVEQFVGVAGFLRPAVAFDAVDAEPVDSVFLILAPRERRERLLDILARLVAVGRDKSLGLLLRGCRTPENVASFLEELDQGAGSAPGAGYAAAWR